MEQCVTIDNDIQCAHTRNRMKLPYTIVQFEQKREELIARSLYKFDQQKTVAPHYNYYVQHHRWLLWFG